MTLTHHLEGTWEWTYSRARHYNANTLLKHAILDHPAFYNHHLAVARCPLEPKFPNLRSFLGFRAWFQGGLESSEIMLGKYRHQTKYLSLIYSVILYYIDPSTSTYTNSMRKTLVHFLCMMCPIILVTISLTYKMYLTLDYEYLLRDRKTRKKGTMS